MAKRSLAPFGALAIGGLVTLYGCTRGVPNVERTPQQAKAEAEHAEAVLPLLPVGGGPQAIPVEVATDEIAEARCQRARRCDEVGAGREHADKSACLASYARKVVEEIDSNHCPEGIDRAALTRCVSEAASELCTHAFAEAEHADSCRAPDLCFGL